jgi:hypothetical protein
LKSLIETAGGKVEDGGWLIVGKEEEGKSKRKKETKKAFLSEMLFVGALRQRLETQGYEL